MAKGKPGADSSVIVTSQIMRKGLIDLAKALFGETPVFWGRYFTSASTAGTVEYRHLKENKVLRDNNIRVLPVARQTTHVNGTVANGSVDAESNSDEPVHQVLHVPGRRRQSELVASLLHRLGANLGGPQRERKRRPIQDFSLHLCDAV